MLCRVVSLRVPPCVPGLHQPLRATPSYAHRPGASLTPGVAPPRPTCNRAPRCNYYQGPQITTYGAPVLRWLKLQAISPANVVGYLCCLWVVRSASSAGTKEECKVTSQYFCTCVCTSASLRTPLALLQVHSLMLTRFDWLPMNMRSAAVLAKKTYKGFTLTYSCFGSDIV